jgi:phosphoglycolate phosphatase-like HAD superfamily hydrolase
MDDVLVLWDIDGTLLNAGGVGRDLYSTVFVQLFGRSLSAYAPMAGRTDRAIILETLTLAGVDEPRRYVDPFIAGLSSQAMAMRAAVATQGQPLPGAAEALAALASAWSLDPVGFLDPARAAADGGHSGPGDAGVPAIPGGSGPGGSGSGGPGSGGPGSASVALAERLTPDMAMATTATMIAKEMPDGVAMPSELPDALPPGGLPPDGLPPDGLPPDGLPRRVHQSVLTGNVRQLAEVKLDALGLRNGLDLCIGAYGEDHEDRAQLVHVARRRAAGVHGRSADAFDGTATVVIGDTPLDILAALDAGARAVGVATGSFAAADLMAAGAHAVLPDLTDTRLVLQTLLALYTGTSPDRAGRRGGLVVRSFRVARLGRCRRRSRASVFPGSRVRAAHRRAVPPSRTGCGRRRPSRSGACPRWSRWLHCRGACRGRGRCRPHGTACRQAPPPGRTGRSSGRGSPSSRPL